VTIVSPAAGCTYPEVLFWHKNLENIQGKFRKEKDSQHSQDLNPQPMVSWSTTQSTTSPYATSHQLSGSITYLNLALTLTDLWFAATNLVHL